MAFCQNSQSDFDQLCQEAESISRELELKAISAKHYKATRELKRKTRRACGTHVEANVFVQRDEFGQLVPKRRRKKAAKAVTSDAATINKPAMLSRQEDFDYSGIPSVSTHNISPVVEDIEILQREVEELLANTEHIQCSNPSSSNTWSIRMDQDKKKWAAIRPEMVEALLTREHTKVSKCQHCSLKPSVIRCKNCIQKQLYCGDCDVMAHQSKLHNRETFVKLDVEGQFHFEEQDCFLPVEAPEHICNCPSDSIVVSAGKRVILIAIDEWKDLLRCFSKKFF
ncbi:hypothetical protein IRJ41_008040 [Triplophysa rosa]|uniref:Uncharacterized protein n=1 Tax=Triplophysa rosa TaxID=992332 RepID=A0A9W8C851_TRIRA|nr:hypothetical protein IRJ41_008040 [Triplophysa rosa]